MATFEDGCYNSITGTSLIAKVLAGRCEMRYVRAAVGKGSIPEGQTPKTMTEPPEYVMDAVISAVTNPVDGECQLTVQISNSDVETGFYLTSIVLYAEDPDLGEVPFTYLYMENYPEWIRPASSAIGKFSEFDLIAAVGDIDEVKAVIDPAAMASIGEVEELIAQHNADPNAHGGGTGGGGSVRIVTADITPESWSENSDAEYSFYHDIEDESIDSSMFPVIALRESSLDTARNCKLCPAAETFDGYIRLKCKMRPEGNISVNCGLFAQGGGGGGGSYRLPTATSYRLGGIKIGSGISVTQDGTASIDGESTVISEAVSQDVQEAMETTISPTEDADEMLDEVFGE